MGDLVWYVSYGSNMDRARLGCYLGRYRRGCCQRDIRVRGRRQGRRSGLASRQALIGRLRRISLGDRACLAIAATTPHGFVLTTDTAWTHLPGHLDIAVQLTRGSNGTGPDCIDQSRLA